MQFHNCINIVTLFIFMLFFLLWYLVCGSKRVGSRRQMSSLVKNKIVQAQQMIYACCYFKHVCTLNFPKLFDIWNCCRFYMQYVHKVTWGKSFPPVLSVLGLFDQII